ncbi:MAG: pyruvate dehydrogenase (acetyl-transferring), homodimeric type [Gammaproteobacteria bacterium]|nr:pyruvate dehydrogenase (acetyl-transferring), homodimeric type [Gammaproteobacteria bacterium]MYF59007.1 pyruvate dehydrogenase (acetyl-transferring), homodimeric type [Gammaproteobacteria bacterium]
MPDDPVQRANPFHDSDPLETREWLESIDSVLREHGPERAAFLLRRITDRAHRSGAHMAYAANTAYLNTIDQADQPEYPGDVALERRIENYIRWNAMAMVVHANRKSSEFGGHIATYASAATLYEVGFNHFWRAPTKENRGDLVYFQGHSSPGIYARAFLEGRLTHKQLARFRQEVGGGGLSSYPHPWLMSDFWQFPTVSMGLGAMMAIFQARFMRYLEHRGLAEMGDRRVWCMLGDGEMDEPESLGAITVPVREGLDNLIFVVNCNLQRLDGPVRGNGKIIQELEAAFLGAGWNVIKSIWGSRWDPLLSRDHNGLLRRRMEECVDGEYQNCKALGGEYTREKFFGAIDGLKDLVGHMSTEDIELLNRGGHDRLKIFAAYERAIQQKGRPTVILAKTVKGFGMGEGGESRMTAHQAKKLDLDALREFRDRFNIPVTDEQLKSTRIPFRMPEEDSEEIRYLKERRRRLGGFMPQRVTKAARLKAPALSKFKSITGGSGTRSISTTMALVRLLQMLTRDKTIGKHVVPIVPDEARTFGMEGMFKQLGIYSSVGQLYTPQDSEQLMAYREDIKGQILEEGINEAGSFCSWLAAGTSYSTHGLPMIPFYIFYSMFGFQRIGDFIWAGGDSQARGFLIGGTSGRTTLAGEGLQHQDGHSHLAASTVPNCLSYDPAYAYELAVIVQDGLRRMFEKQENVFYYITTMNDNYRQPPMRRDMREGILKGIYRLPGDGEGAEDAERVQLFGSGAILNETVGAANLLRTEYGVEADVWSVTSYNQLRRDGMACERYNRMNPGEEPRRAYLAEALGDATGPFIAASDYMAALPDSIRQWVPGTFITLGTDGFGRSDGRSALRNHFEVDARYIAAAALSALAAEERIDPGKVSEAMRKWEIDPAKADPVTL